MHTKMDGIFDKKSAYELNKNNKQLKHLKRFKKLK